MMNSDEPAVARSPRPEPASSAYDFAMLSFAEFGDVV